MVREDCAECASFTNCDGTDCGETHHMVAEMVATDEGHEAWHRTHYCTCGRPKIGPDGTPDDVEGRCRYGRCVELTCPDCGADRGGWGPALCRCSSSWRTRLYFRLAGWFRRSR